MVTLSVRCLVLYQMDVVQRLAHQSHYIDQPTNSVNGNFPGKKELVENLIFKWSDIVSIEIPDVDPEYAVMGKKNTYTLFLCELLFLVLMHSQIFVLRELSVVDF